MVYFRIHNSRSFFFFRQKAAYEMRISDWSSDVCSSDLVAEAIRLMKVQHAVITSVNRDELKDKGATVWAETIREVKKLSPGTTIETLIQFGSASWRERVCQIVKISVVAVLFNKK